MLLKLNTAHVGAFITAAFLLCTASTAHAVPTFFVNNPSTNSTDWNTSVIGLGGAVNSNVNFDAHPLGALNDGFYTGSDGVTLSATGAFGNVQFGAGPGQGNTAGSQPGEGLHPASNFLSGSAGSKTLTVSFSSTVLGVALATLDYFDSNPSDRMSITAFDGINGTGTNLGSALSVNQNFQANNLYYMGVSDASNTIRSVVFSYSGAGTGDRIGIDNILFAQVPEQATLTLFGLGLLGLGFARRRK